MSAVNGTGVLRPPARPLTQLAVALGLASGGLVSAWALKFVRGYLFHVALIGAWIPSIQASRIDPSRALQAGY